MALLEDDEEQSRNKQVVPINVVQPSIVTLHGPAAQPRHEIEGVRTVIVQRQRTRDRAATIARKARE